MKITKYLRDQMRLIIFQLVLLGFTLSVIVLDRANQMKSSDVRYLFVVSLMLFAIYLGADYLIARSHHHNLVKLMAAQGTEWVSNLPIAKTAQQATYQNLLLKLYYEHNEETRRFQTRSQEDLEFVTCWVHEIKTPIAVANLLIQNSPGSASEETLDSLEEELAKIEDHVMKALYYSRSNDFAKDYLIKELALDEVIKDSVKSHAPVFIRKRLKIQINDISDRIATDKKWLGFIIDQVMDNALKYTGEDGRITVSTKNQDNELILTITDTGMGIRSEDLNRVFDRGFTGHNGRQASSSTGMGLYLCQRVARKLGHYLTVSSIVDYGTSISIHFPKWSNYFDVTKM